MRSHALGQPVRQALALTHERGHASPQTVNREWTVNEWVCSLVGLESQSINQSIGDY